MTIAIYIERVYRLIQRTVKGTTKKKAGSYAEMDVSAQGPRSRLAGPPMALIGAHADLPTTHPKNA